MAYDYQKVQAWLQRVAPDVSLPLFLELHDVDVPTYQSAEFAALYDEAIQFSTWERVNACYGLRDLIDQQVRETTQRWAQKARAEDDVATSLTFTAVAEGDPRYTPRMTLLAPVTPDVCPVCQQPYVHHQHPMKPLGVIISSTCGCTGETDNAKEAERRRRGSAGPRR